MPSELKVLFAEDDESNVPELLYELRRSGVEVRSRTASVESLLRIALEDWSPDVLVCDYSLPAVLGGRVVQLAHELRPAVPVLIVTDAAGEAAAIEFLGHGVSAYVLRSDLRQIGPAIRRAVADAHNRGVSEERLDRCGALRPVPQSIGTTEVRGQEAGR